MVEAFSFEELVTLCADLGVDADIIPGRDKGEEYWVDQFITYFDRRNETPALVAKLRAERPNVDWAYVEVQPVAQTAMANPVAAVPIPWLVAGAGVLLLMVLIAVVVPKLGSGAAPATSTATVLAASSATLVPTEAVATLQASSTPTALATTTAAATPASATAAEPMPSDHFNILFVEFGQLSSSGVASSTEGTRLSLSAAETFKTYLTEALPADVQLDFPPLVWHSRDAAQHGWQIGAITTRTEAERVAKDIGAQMVVYGNFAARADIAAPNGQLDVGFYVARVANAADEIVGPYQLSAPIPVRWPMTADVENSTRLALNDRNRLLSRFALGLAYDLFGRPEQALIIFQDADARTTASYTVGREVLYFFIAREQLLLQHTQEAEQMHQKALALNPRYARANLGLGDVYLQYAAAITMPETLLQSEVLTNAAAQYGLAEQQAALSPDVPQLVPLARLGLGLVKQMQAGAHYQLDQQAEAKALMTDAVRLLEPALQILGQRPDGQRRTLALGYLSLAEANWTGARLAGESATEIQLRNAFYQKADDAYAACIALDVGTDNFLSKNIVDACKRNQRAMSAERPE